MEQQQDQQQEQQQEQQEQQEQQLQQQQQQQSQTVGNDRSYVADINFTSTQPDELSMMKGNMLEVLFDEEEREKNQWWRAKNLETGETGLVPYNYLTKCTGRRRRASAFDGWMDINRMDANRLLLRAGLKAGTYIIRPCSKPNAKLALSVRTPDKQRQNNFLVKHYEIKNSPDGSMYFIDESMVYSSVQTLVDEYKNENLCFPLTDPCPTEPPVVQFKDIEVNRDVVNWERKLGAGSFGDVWLAKWNDTLDVAVRTLKQGTAMSPEKFLDEAKMMHKLSHPKIVKILGVCTELRDPDDQILIITEFMENGSLLDYLRSKNTSSDRLPMEVLLDIAYQIADGMSYLEEKKFVHRDLRAANVLVGRDNFVKVAEFGLARLVQEDETYQAESVINFPVKWTAPEAMDENRFTTKSDVWSYGVLLYEILTHGGQLYVGMTNREVMQFVRDPNNRLPVPQSANMTKADKQIAARIHEQYMLQCWHHLPEERPTFMTLRNEFEDMHERLEQQ